MINWSELFQLQQEFDERIIREKGLDGTETIPWRVTAFIVELSEFANEARWFKMWSNDKEPRRKPKHCPKCDGSGQVRYYTTSTCERCNGEGFESIDPLLEEFVDALHFIIGIGLELDCTTFYTTDEELRATAAKDEASNDPNELFQGIVRSMTILSGSWSLRDVHATLEAWSFSFMLLRLLGWHFEITDDEIVTAFKAKHAVNVERQDRGY